MDGTVRIAWEYNVLYKAGNKYYSRLEKEKGISLLGLSILNTGQDTFYFPGDLQIYGGDEKLYPLHPEDVKMILNQVEDKRNPYEGDLDWGLVFVIPARLINLGLRASADVDLSREVDRTYLYSCAVGPGHHTTGLVAFPVAQWRPLGFVEQIFP